MVDSVTHNIRIRVDVSDTRRAERTVEGSLNRIDRKATQTSKRVSLIGRSFDSLRTSVLSLNGALAGFSAGLAAIATITTISSFGDQMATVRAVTEATGNEFTLLRNKALELGATTRFTATQAGQALEFLGRAGAGAAGSIELIETTLKLAQAEGLELAEAADILAKSTRGMRLELTEGARVADVLSKVASSSSTNVRELGTAFRYAAAISAGFGVSVEELGAVLAVLANNSQSASVGGTVIRGILSRLATPTKELTDGLKEIGLTLEDVNPATKSFIEILKTLKNAGATTSKVFELFRQRAGAGAEILINNISEIERLLDVADRAAGTLDFKFDIKADTLANDLYTALSALQDLLIALGDAGIEAALRAILQGFATVVRTISDGIRALTPLIYNLGIGIAIAFSPFALLGFLAGVVRLIALIPALIALIARLAVGMVVLAASNPFTAIAVAIGLAITAFQRFGDQIPVAGARYATLADVWQVISNRIGSFFDKIARSAAVAFDLVLKAGTTVANGVIRAFEYMGNFVLKTLQAILNGARDVINAIGEFTNLGTIEGVDLGEVNLGEFRAPTFIKDILKEADEIALDRIAQQKKARADLVGTLNEQTKALGETETKTKALTDAAGAGNKAIDYTKQLLEQIQGPADTARESLGVLVDLYRDGEISASQFADAQQRLRDQLLASDQSFGAGILRGLNRVAEGATRVGDAVENFVSGAFSKASDAIANFVTSGKLNFKDLVNSILADLVRLATNQLFGQLAQGLLGGLGGGGNILGGLLGFATGGSVMVGGTGGTDSQIVGPFRATPGERIDFLTPQQQSAGGGGGTVVNVINNSGAEVRQEQRRGAGGQDIVDVIIGAVNDGAARGRLDSAFAGRFKLSPATRRR